MESRAALDLALLGESVGIWSRDDVNGNEEYWSPKFYELLGYEVGEIPSTLEQFRRMLHPDDLERTFTMVDAHFAGECDFTVDYRVRTKARGYRWFRGSGSVSRGADGEPMHMVGSIIDIDVGMRALARLRGLNEDLEHFIQIAGIDLREPARRQLMLADLILEDHKGALEPDLERLLVESQKQSRRTLDLLDAARTIAQMQTRSPESEDVELLPLLEAIVADVVPNASSADIELDVPESVWTNWGVLRFLFHNLISNAVKHGPPHVGLVISTTTADDRCRFVVENSWADDAQHLAEWLAPIDHETAHDRFGMHLSLCKRAALVLGGDLWLAPTAEKFRVEFSVGGER